MCWDPLPVHLGGIDNTMSWRACSFFYMVTVLFSENNDTNLLWLKICRKCDLEGLDRWEMRQEVVTNLIRNAASGSESFLSLLFNRSHETRVMLYDNVPCLSRWRHCWCSPHASPRCGRTHWQDWSLPQGPCSIITQRLAIAVREKRKQQQNEGSFAHSIWKFMLSTRAHFKCSEAQFV